MAEQTLSAEVIARVEAAAAQLDRERGEKEKLYIVRPGDRRLFRICGEMGGYEWNDVHDERGAWFIVLGRETTDEKCVRMAKRFGLDADGLIAARDDDRWKDFEIYHWGPLQ